MARTIRFWVNWKSNACCCDYKVDKLAANWYQIYVGLEPKKGERPPVFWFIFLLFFLNCMWKVSKNTSESSFFWNFKVLAIHSNPRVLIFRKLSCQILRICCTTPSPPPRSGNSLYNECGFHSSWSLCLNQLQLPGVKSLCSPYLNSV